MKKIHISGMLAFWVFYVLAWASVSVSVMLMYVHLRGNLCLAEAAVNAFVVMAPYFLLGAKWRWTALVPAWGVAAFYLTNLWYWRFFNDFMPLSNYFLWSNVGNEVIDTTLMLVKAKDMAFLLMPAVTTVAYFAMLRKPLASYQVSSRWKWVSPVAAMALFGTCYSTELTNGSFGVPQVSPWVEYNQHGLVGYVAKESLVSLERKMQNREATEEDLKTIRQYNDQRMAIVADDTAAVHTLGGGKSALPSWCIYWGLLVLLIALRCLLPAFTREIIQTIYAFAFILLFVNAPRATWVDRFLGELGRRSTSMWFVHSYFCYYLFHDFIYGFKYPLLIFAVLIAVSYVCAVGIDWIKAKIRI